MPSRRSCRISTLSPSRQNGLPAWCRRSASYHQLAQLRSRASAGRGLLDASSSVCVSVCGGTDIVSCGAPRSTAVLMSGMDLRSAARAGALFSGIDVVVAHDVFCMPSGRRRRYFSPRLVERIGRRSATVTGHRTPLSVCCDQHSFVGLESAARPGPHFLGNGRVHSDGHVAQHRRRRSGVDIAQLLRRGRTRPPQGFPHRTSNSRGSPMAGPTSRRLVACPKPDQFSLPRRPRGACRPCSSNLAEFGGATCHPDTR